MNDNQSKVLTVLFQKPEYHFHIRELARETKLNPNTIINITDELFKKKIVIKKKVKHLVEVYCNLDSFEYLRNKRLFNLKSIYSSGLIDELVDFYNHPRAIVVFGSFSRGEDNSQSDIDLAVISKTEKEPNLKKYEHKLSRKIHLLSFNKEISPEFFNNLINGVVLFGYLKDERV